MGPVDKSQFRLLTRAFRLVQGDTTTLLFHIARATPFSGLRMFLVFAFVGPVAIGQATAQAKAVQQHESSAPAPLAKTQPTTKPATQPAQEQSTAATALGITVEDPVEPAAKDLFLDAKPLSDITDLVGTYLEVKPAAKTSPLDKIKGQKFARSPACENSALVIRLENGQIVLQWGSADNVQRFASFAQRSGKIVLNSPQQKISFERHAPGVLQLRMQRPGRPFSPAYLYAESNYAATLPAQKKSSAGCNF